MLYFSAHWCGPCRQFTPAFAEFYLKHKDKLEVVFVSSDRDEPSFNEYFGEMPWLSLPFADRDRKNMLSKKFKVKGIPSVVFLDAATGVAYETNGRSVITSDPQALNYPWKPPTIAEALGTEFVRKDGSKVTVASLKGKYIAIYFSAHWCPPCRGFTPDLVKTYNKLIADGKPFEIVFASSDRSKEDFDEYFSEMPWLALPFDDREKKETLSNLFEVSGIPTLIMLDPELNVLNKGLRAYVSSDPEGLQFPWAPKSVVTLEEGVGDVNDAPAVIVLMEDENDTVHAQFESILTFVSDQYQGDDPVLFLISKEPNSISKQIMQLCSIVPEKGTRTLCNGDMCMKLQNSTMVILLDIPDNGGFYRMEGELSKENILAFFKSYENGSLKDKRHQLSQ